MEQLSGTARFWHWWAACSLRRAVLVALLGTLALVASAPFAARLYGDLRTDLRELLPQGAPAAVALAELEKRIGGLSHLAIVVRTDDLKAGGRFLHPPPAPFKGIPPPPLAPGPLRGATPRGNPPPAPAPPPPAQGPAPAARR